MTAEAAALLAIIAAVYLLSCLIWPWTRCGRCDGGRLRAGHQRKVWRDCGRCSGTGRRRRFGQWLLDVVTGRAE